MLSTPEIVYLSIADCVDQASIGLANYTAESNERLLTAARRGTSTRQEDSKEFKKRKREEQMKEVREKQLQVFAGDGWDSE